jgi:hypothetical protein
MEITSGGLNSRAGGRSLESFLRGLDRDIKKKNAAIAIPTTCGEGWEG